MSFEDFYELAKYANVAWKGSFTEDEIKENADIYYSDYMWSLMNNTVSESIKTLCELLEEDIECDPDLEEPREWLQKIKADLKF